MKITNNLKERFTKDCKIPIKLYIEPYFTERINLLDKFYDTKSKWQAFVEMIEKFPNGEEYFTIFNSTKDAVIDFIKSRPAYIAFNQQDMNQFAVKNKNFPTKDIYKPTNIGRSFISIDMKKANFSSLRYYDASIFDNADTWEDFISKFTDNEFIINSKSIREVIMGNCNSGRVTTYEKFITDQLLTLIIEAGIKPNNIVFFSNDEIVVDVTDLDITTTTATYDNIIKICDKFDVPFRAEIFRLLAVTKNDKVVGYIKHMLDGSYDFKCFNNQDLLFTLRLLSGEDIKDLDLVFENDKCLATYMTKPEIKLITKGVVNEKNM